MSVYSAQNIITVPIKSFYCYCWYDKKNFRIHYMNTVFSIATNKLYTYKMFMYDAFINILAKGNEFIETNIGTVEKY